MKLFRFFKSTAFRVVASLAIFASWTQAADMTGAGATFPYPIYAKWAEAYKQVSGNNLNYQSIGSGGGIKQIKAKTVDFGASDMPLQAEELEKEGLFQFPAIIGGVVPVINLDGIKEGQLKLTGPVLADIYLGKITKWNAPEIVALNPDVKLPATDITVVHRADGSGTSFLFTDYLSKVSPAFKAAVGTGAAVKWPAGIGGKGNEGVAANVQRIKASIGYVEYAYAKKNNIVYTQLKNRDNQFVSPSEAGFQAAAANAEWAKNPTFAVLLTDEPGSTSWPMTGASFILMHKVQPDPAKAKAVLSFFGWAYKNGAKMAADLNYVPLPVTLTDLVQSAWKTTFKDSSGKPVL